jgi:SAM-dependent methyltransferase
MDVEQRRPEMGAGGYARDDSSVEFYLRVNALVGEQSVVLDLGAGRGAGLEKIEVFPKSLKRLRGRVGRLFGCDVDKAVLGNPYLDEARLIRPDGTLPFDDAMFDMVISDWVIEHIDNVEVFVSEVGRVLKPGGWFCARTPNKWGYIALGSRMTPAVLEQAVLGRLQPLRQERDVFPKRYRLNTLRAVRRAFDERGWRDCSYSCSATPAYSGSSGVLFSIVDLFQTKTPAAFDTVLMVFLQKR